MTSYWRQMQEAKERDKAHSEERARKEAYDRDYEKEHGEKPPEPEKDDYDCSTTGDVDYD